MKLATNIAGGLMGLVFIAFSLIVLLDLVHPPPMPAGTPAAMFMGALGPTGYFKFVKVCELIGGCLVAVPRTRNYGLLILGPIVVNIVMFQYYLDRARLPLAQPFAGLTAFLIWGYRERFAGIFKP